MRQGNVSGLNLPNEVTLPIDDHVAVADNLEKPAEATGAKQADEEVVLVFVKAPNDGPQLGSVGLQPLGNQRMLGGHARDPRVQIRNLFLAVNDLLTEADQAELRLIERSFQYQGMRLRCGQITDQQALRLLVFELILRLGRRRCAGRSGGCS